jgi:hypothetical protein
VKDDALAPRHQPISSQRRIRGRAPQLRYTHVEPEGIPAFAADVAEQPVLYGTARDRVPRPGPRRTAATCSREFCLSPDRRRLEGPSRLHSYSHSPGPGMRAHAAHRASIAPNTIGRSRPGVSLWRLPGLLMCAGRRCPGASVLSGVATPGSALSGVAGSSPHSIRGRRLRRRGDADRQVRSPVSSVSRAFGETRRRLGREPPGSRLGSTGAMRGELVPLRGDGRLRWVQSGVDCQPVRATWVPAL